MLSLAAGQASRRLFQIFMVLMTMMLLETTAFAQEAHRAGGEANLKLPDLHGVNFMGNIPGDTLLMWGLGICVLGLVFGLAIYMQLKNLPVHRSMLEISELIYETCKTYLVTQGKFILILEAFIAVI
ncbi:MAG: sodium-translocating pyrophosphatase, partial [Terriglobales bacterium]